MLKRVVVEDSLLKFDRHLDTIMQTSLDAALASSSPTDVASNIGTGLRSLRDSVSEQHRFLMNSSLKKVENELPYTG